MGYPTPRLARTKLGGEHTQRSARAQSSVARALDPEQLVDLGLRGQASRNRPGRGERRRRDGRGRLSRARARAAPDRHERRTRRELSAELSRLHRASAIEGDVQEPTLR